MAAILQPNAMNSVDEIEKTLNDKAKKNQLTKINVKNLIKVILSHLINIHTSVELINLSCTYINKLFVKLNINYVHQKAFVVYFSGKGKGCILKNINRYVYTF